MGVKLLKVALFFLIYYKNRKTSIPKSIEKIVVTTLTPKDVSLLFWLLSIIYSFFCMS